MAFTDKVVLITGASSGIGAACALQFAKLSAKLSLVGRNENNLKDISQQCEETNGQKPLTIVADISIEDDVGRIVTETLENYERIDVLVNNAGILLMAGILDDISNLDHMIATNVRGTFLMTQQVVPHLMKSKGNIVNISSILSTTPMPNMMSYSITKAAIDVLTKCVALQFAKSGVRVNSVNPGPVPTNLFTRGGVSKELNDQLYAGMEAAMPLKKLAKCEDVANMVCFLASDDASCITGSCHAVDCGLHLGDPEIPM